VSRIAPTAAEQVEIEKRRPFRKIDVDTRLIQQQFTCWDCGRSIPPFEADHSTPRANGGKTELANLILRCPPCHQRKTKVDRPAIAKANRNRKKNAAPETRALAKPKRKIASRPFQKARK
jgi:5-methylcytosine-specific restriction endonuclease McrA